MLNFYGSPYSPYSIKIQYFLEETGIPFKMHQVNLREAAGRAQLDAVNPFGKVPAIELGGNTLGESNAILRYLAAKYERYDLYPANLEDRGQVDMVYEFVQSHVGAHMQKIAWNMYYAPKFGMQTSMQAVDEARADLLRNLPRLESWLAGRKFLAGPTLTLADIGLLPIAASYRHAQISLLDFPHFQTWITQMTERPAWKKVQAEVDRVLQAMATR